MRRQRGVSIAMVVVVLAILMTALLAAMMLSRITDADRARTDTQRALAKAQDALDQFAASMHRLPCPADPATDTGLEVMASTSTCSFPGGTLPWQTLGLTHDEGYDAWGDKISFRVYDAAAGGGSLVQPEGVSMIECDLKNTPLAPPQVDETVDPATGLCRANSDPYQRSTIDKNVYNNRSGGYPITVREYLYSDGPGNPPPTNIPTNVGYVLISHGPTGYGAYTVSGVRKSLSDVRNHELDNTTATGPFHIHPFSNVDVEASDKYHFDDLIVYRTLPDLMSRTGLSARDWPEFGGAVFNAQTIAAALGRSSVSPGDLGTSSINFGTVTATATTSNLSLISDATSGEGLGSSGIFGGYLNNFENNSISFQFGYDATKFAVTLGDFGTFSGFSERAQLVFRDGNGNTLASVTASACNPDGGIASYSVTLIPSPPAGLSASQSNSGGALAAGTTFAYRVSAYNSIGESMPGTEVTQKTTNGGGSNHTVTLGWSPVSGATGYRVYGRAPAGELLLADVGSAVTFTDTGGLTPLGAMPSGAGFRTVEVRPMSSINGSGTTFYSFFFVNEVKACPASTTSCTTSLAAPANNCP